MTVGADDVALTWLPQPVQNGLPGSCGVPQFVQ